LSLKTGENLTPIVAVGQANSFLVGKPSAKEKRDIATSLVTINPKTNLRLRYVFIVPKAAPPWQLIFQKTPLADLSNVRLAQKKESFTFLAGAITISREIAPGHFKRSADLGKSAAVEFASTVGVSAGAVLPSQTAEQGSVSIDTLQVDEVLASQSQSRSIPAVSMCRSPDGTMLTYLVGKITLKGSIEPLHRISQDKGKGVVTEYVSNVAARKGDQLAAVGSDCCVFTVGTKLSAR
jgi:hypothetical protein